MLHDTSARWLSIIGIGEDGLDGLGTEARAALERASVVAGGRRHLDLVRALGKREIVWDNPFRDTIPKLLALRGQNIAVLASGDPFWFGAGGSLSDEIPIGEMQVFPAPSTFALCAVRLGWKLERVATLGLHARPLARLRPHMRTSNELIVLVRDADAVRELADLVTRWGFGPSSLTILERLGGPHERVRKVQADAFAFDDVAAPVAVAIDVVSMPGAMILPVVAGLPDEAFSHDGQLTKREIRAMTLSALAPRGNELLWDIGVGSGSISIEWLLAHAQNRAIGIEAREDRLQRAQQNALDLGVPHLDLRLGAAPQILAGLPAPNAIFIGGGVSVPGVIDAALGALKPGGRLVANGVTLETEAVLIQAAAKHGGTLTRIAVERAAPVGRMTAWRASMPIVQWSFVR